jgi:hypothetical protein
MNSRLKTPGFIADASLILSYDKYISKTSYTIRTCDEKMVVPQMTQTCFQACKQAGNSDDMCHLYCDPYTL